jgi:hypothetical protein
VTASHSARDSRTSSHGGYGFTVTVYDDLVCRDRHGRRDHRDRDRSGAEPALLARSRLAVPPVRVPLNRSRNAASTTKRPMSGKYAASRRETRRNRRQDRALEAAGGRDGAGVAVRRSETLFIIPDRLSIRIPRLVPETCVGGVGAPVAEPGPQRLLPLSRDPCQSESGRSWSATYLKSMLVLCRIQPRPRASCAHAS